ncbi:MAG: GPW/gp25 family protein [Acidobacteriia bacterium]|nr:GPW/gp25 family protein [Terriglobia bacterium]
MDNNSSEGKGFLGTGMTFPLQVDGQGHIAMNSFENHVRQSILLIVQTARGERLMRSDFGAGLFDQVFAPLNTTTTSLLAHDVKEALIRFEPRIEVLDVAVTADAQREDVLLIDVQYRVRRTDTQFNVVYPFFLQKGIL